MSGRLFDVADVPPDVAGAVEVLRGLPAPSAAGIVLAPLSFKAANAVIASLHRHSVPAHAMKFAIRAHLHGEPVGVAIAGKPIARLLDDGLTLEVLRVCTWTPARNVCSRLYGACCRAGAAMGYTKAITYTTADETAASVRASGFVEVGRRRAESWDTPARPRDPGHHVLADRVRWERAL